MTRITHSRSSGLAGAFLVALVIIGNAGPLAGQSQTMAPVEVPEAVRIPRPTEQELDRARRTLDEFLQTTDAATREMLARYPGLLEVRPPRVNTATIPDLSPRFRQKHELNLEVARQGDVELLLMGDSITDFWRDTEGRFAGKAVLDEFFGQWTIGNFGIAGDTTQGVLYRLRNGEGEGFSPRAIMLMIGTNNTRLNTAAEIAEGIGAVVLELRQHFPAARILLLGVFPRSGANDPVRDQIAEINTSIAHLHDGEFVHYLDIGEVFLDEDGNIPVEVMGDGLHPSAVGYRLWAEAVQEPLTQLMNGE